MNQRVLATVLSFIALAPWTGTANAGGNAGSDNWSVFCVCGDFIDPSPCGNATVGVGCFNSTLLGTGVSATGSFDTAADDVVLTAFDAPPNQLGLFFLSYSPQFGQQTFGDGLLCLAPPFRRLGVLNSGSSGTFVHGPGSVAAANIQPGDQVYFQAIYRDPQGPCGTTFNLSSGIVTNWQ